MSRSLPDRDVVDDDLRVQIDATIHEAFTQDDTETKKWLHERFDDREPTLEELVEAIATQMEEIKNRSRSCGQWAGLVTS